MSASSGEHTLKTIRLDRFLDHIAEGRKNNQDYCFILGAGASKDSGIPTGRELIDEWRKYLVTKSPEYLLDIMKELGIADKYDYFFGSKYTKKSDDYFDVFDMRFAGQPAAAYKELQDKMKDAKASFGYYALATLLSEEQTGINIVITTNFDSLVEDSLFICRSTHPLIVGHESLASYINAPENKNRPIVAKVHRDLYYQPFNRNEELDKLAENWEEPLKDVLSKYIPIVIGYAGGDKTLMSLLKEIKLPGAYWFNYDGADNVDDKVKKLLNADGRYIVDTKKLGFDEIMYKLVKKLLPEFDFGSITKSLTDTAENRAEQFEKQVSIFANRPDSSESGAPEPVGDHSSAAPQKDAAPDVENESAVSTQQSDRADTDTQEIPASFDDQSVMNLILANKDAYNSRQYALSYAICTELINRHPDNAEYYHSRVDTLHAMKRYEDALKDQTKAIELDPGNDLYYHSRSTTLFAMGRYDDALADISKAIELDPNNASYYSWRGTILYEIKRYDDALADKTKAIELDPNNADYYRWRSTTLYAMGRTDDAEKDLDEANRLSKAASGT